MPGCAARRVGHRRARETDPLDWPRAHRHHRNRNRLARRDRHRRGLEGDSRGPLRDRRAHTLRPGRPSDHRRRARSRLRPDGGRVAKEARRARSQRPARDDRGPGGRRRGRPARASTASGSACSSDAAIGGFLTILEQHDIMRERGWSRVAPHFFPRRSSTPRAGRSRRCSTSRARTTRRARRARPARTRSARPPSCCRRGGADAVVAGGVEACLHPLAARGLHDDDRASAPRGPGEPVETASRPFDATRNGFVCSEGSTIVVLEPLDAAVARGARVHAEVIGHGNSNDAFHVAAPHPESRGLIQMMSRGLALGRASRPRRSATSTRTARRHRRATPPRPSRSSHLRRPRVRARGVLHEGRDRAPVRCRRGVRDRDVHARLSRRRSPVDAALPRRRSECDLDYVTEGARDNESGSRCRTRSGSAAITAVCSSAARR